jgi:mono/diheme cytochrome c family protein
MKHLKRILVSLLLVTLAAAPLLAAEGGNPKKGKYLFKKNCKACHVEGAEGGPLTPLSKTQNQWDRFFDRDKHQKNPAGMNGLSEQDIKDVQQFLFDHAADSPQPQTCG